MAYKDKPPYMWQLEDRDEFAKSRGWALWTFSQIQLPDNATAINVAFIDGETETVELEQEGGYRFGSYAPGPVLFWSKIDE